VSLFARILSFLGCAALFSVVAFYLFFIIMIGDCDPEPIAHAKCETFRNRELLVLVAVSGAIYILLGWAFFGRGRRSKVKN
jgi:hypothetical protein